MTRQRVICVGNELCHDDGVAFAVSRELAPHIVAETQIDVVHVAELGVSCLDAFLEIEHVVVLDAVVTGHEPGTCTQLANLDFAPRPTCSIGHAVSLDSLLELVAHLQGPTRTPRVTVIGIEALDLSPFGTELSPCVRASIPRAVELVLRALGLEGVVATPNWSA